MSKFLMCFVWLFFSLSAISNTDIRGLDPLEQKKLLKFKKMDETSTDASFSEFKKKILVAIENKDVKFISSILARDNSDFFEKAKYNSAHYKTDILGRTSQDYERRMCKRSH